ncbi:hypothetical protein DFR24_3250 [Panacagrimonas perspica]|uniref:Uncharacterized protein n=1 Tax=Panacagrimonas perspica TaxID=381431 RepID=A0A4R7P717_9GAMM|nr:hypothetical protein [Panacagrimonas perspica]TDU28870.1 hypothetical protein DFR24_3250 [Panacagrimonas perspica]THD02303.1 hypothetical protein B1810_15355 [Panacagrimonas perspica]
MKSYLLVVAEPKIGSGEKPNPAQGCWASEAACAVEETARASATLRIATASGTRPAVSRLSLEPRFHYELADLAFAAAIARPSARHPESSSLSLVDLTERAFVCARNLASALRARGETQDKILEALERAARAALKERAGFDAAAAAQPAVAARLGVADVAEALDAAVRGARERGSAVMRVLEPAFATVLALRDVDLRTVDGLIVAGAPANDAGTDPDVADAIGRAHALGKPIALLSYGAAAALEAGRLGDGRWLFDGYVATGPSADERDQVREAMSIDVADTETLLKNRGAVVATAAPWTPNVRIDRNLISTQNYLSASAAVSRLLGRASR